jgi:hypothetical protein
MEIKNTSDQKNKNDLISDIHAIEIKNTAITDNQINILFLFFESIKNENHIDHIIVKIAKII